MSKRDKVTVDNIIGLVHTDEMTNSVDEVRKLRGRKNKRFTYDNKQVAILKNNKFWLEGAIATACNHSEICNELNALVDENEQLKQNCKNYEWYKQYKTVLNENEQLKKDCTVLICHNQEYRKENEQLKSFKQKVFDLIDKTIEEETQIAENIEEVTQETRPYAVAVNRLTIKTLENLKWELQKE